MQAIESLLSTGVYVNIVPKHEMGTKGLLFMGYGPKGTHDLTYNEKNHTRYRIGATDGVATYSPIMTVKSK